MSARTVTRRLAADVYAERGATAARRIVQVSVRLHYNPADPYAVELAFTDTPSGLVIWSLARDLLAEGLTNPAGLGDVRLRPHRGLVEMRLSTPTGWAALYFAHAQLAEAIAATEQLVPRGTEPDHIDWNVELTRLGVT